MRFCGRCGTALALRCSHCGAETPPDFRVCGHCGRSLQEAPAPPPPAAPERPVYTPKHLAEKILKSRSVLEGERRQVTVLFADLAGFTSLAEERDPEEVHRLINGCFERITAEVHRFASWRSAAATPQPPSKVWTAPSPSLAASAIRR